MRKPQFCNQDWLTMSPAEGGKICGKCQHTIVDFSKMNWTEIEQIQKNHNGTLCGMYKAKQLDYWGQEPPLLIPGRKALTISSILLTVGSFLPFEAKSQEQSRVQKSVISESQIDNNKTPSEKSVRNENQDSVAVSKEKVPIVLRGYVEDERMEPMPFVNISIPHLGMFTTTDFEGFYVIKVDSWVKLQTLRMDSISFSYPGCKTQQISLRDTKQGTNFRQTQLKDDASQINVFYVKRPSLWKRTMQGLKSLF